MISLEQLKQRKIAQWAVAYLAAAWLVMQLGQWLSEAYAWPNIVLRLLPVILGVGLLIVLVLAWYHGEEGRQRVSAPELVMIAGILLLAGIGISVVRGGGDQTSDATGDVASAVQAEQGSIAVLPFTDMSEEKDQAFFSDGLTEELLNVLAQIPELRVAARTSSFSFRDKNVPIDSIGRALRVEYVLEGSVRSVGERVRITAQLIKAATGFHQWSRAYDRDVKDIFAVQDEISRSIVQALRLKIKSGMDTTSLARAGTQTPEAHELVLKAGYLRGQRTAAGIEQAVKAYNEAIALDPNYAEAYAGLGDAIQYQAYRRYVPPGEGYERARVAVKKALELNPDNAQAHAVLARILDLHDWDFKAAEKEFERAIELNPGLADAYAFRAWLLMRLGRREESIAAAKRAVLLNPIAPNAYNTLGSMYSYADRMPEAIEAYRKALAVAPVPDVIESNLMLTFSDNRQYDEAVALADKLIKSAADDDFTLAAAAFVYAHAGRKADAEKAAAQLAGIPNVSPYLVASARVGLGNKDEVFKLLERAVAMRDDYVPDVGVDPVFATLRGDPRMKSLLKKIGLPN